MGTEKPERELGKGKTWVGKVWKNAQKKENKKKWIGRKMTKTGESRKHDQEMRNGGENERKGENGKGAND